MAIKIEERRQVNWLNILLTIVVVGVLVLGGYYLFFKKPELIEIVAPSGSGDLNQLTQIELDPQSLINSPKFRLLRQVEESQVISNPGRDNPFTPY